MLRERISASENEYHRKDDIRQFKKYDRNDYYLQKYSYDLQSELTEDQTNDNQSKHVPQMTPAQVKDAQDDYRRAGGGTAPPNASTGGAGGRGSSRYYLRPEYQMQGPRHHEPNARHDYSVSRDYHPQEKLDDIYQRHKEDFFGQHRIKERDDLPPPAGYGGPPSPDDPFARQRAQRPPSDRYGSRIPPEYPQNVPPEYTPMYTPPTTTAPGGPERVSRLLELYGSTYDSRATPGSRSHTDLYGSLDGRGSRLSDIFPTSDATRLRQTTEFRQNEETRSLSGRDCGNLAEMYRRREIPPGGEYRLHDYSRPQPSRHDYRPQQKPQMDQDVIENPMYEVDRRATPRTPGPRTPTPNPPTPSHPQHMAPHLHHHLGRTSPRPVQEVRYTQAIANQEDAIRANYMLFGDARRIVPVGGRAEGQRANSTPNAALGGSMTAAAAVVSNRQQQHLMHQGPPGSSQQMPPQQQLGGHQMGPPPSHQYGPNSSQPPMHSVVGGTNTTSSVHSSGPQPPQNQQQSQQNSQAHHHPAPQPTQQPTRDHQPSTASSHHPHTSSSGTSNTPAHSYAAVATSRPSGIPSARTASTTNSGGASTNMSSSMANSSPHTNNRGISHQTNKAKPIVQPLSRKEQLKEFLKKETKEFFGLDETNESSQKQRWEEKRRRLASRKYGNLRENSTSLSASLSASAAAGFGSGIGGRCVASGGATVAVGGRGYGSDYGGEFRDIRDIPDSAWRDGRDSPSGNVKPPPRRGKDSVAKMTWDGISYLVNTVSKRRAKGHIHTTPGGQSKSRSYAPTSLHSLDSMDNLIPPHSRSDSSPASSSSSSSNSTQPTDQYSNELLNDEVFFDGKVASTPEGDSTNESNKESIGSGKQHYHSSINQHEWYRPSIAATNNSGNDGVDSGGLGASGRMEARVGRSRIWKRILDHCFDNSDRHQYGAGISGKVIAKSFRKPRSFNSLYQTNRHMQGNMKQQLHQQLDEMEDYRPYFTWWVTSVQVVILLLSLMLYGPAPYGVSMRQRDSQVLMESLSIKTVKFSEPENFWWGPRASVLIHLGAKYSPCMRKDEKLFREIEENRRSERETGCCIRNDDSGCVQSSRRECTPHTGDGEGIGHMTSEQVVVWKKWSELSKGPNGRLSGSVCGQDPDYCKEPASVPPHEWPDDITRWPICRKKTSMQALRKIHAAEHMACEVIGHPCCIGIHGECRISTREYCKFVGGYFHEEATLCSQVSCMNNVCGMIPFHNPDHPDQFYRLWTSLFMHAGVFHLAITIFIQIFYMRDLEKLAGPVRIGFIYIVSGIAGNLASAIFVPYRAEVGPSGSQFGLLACLYVELINCWPLIRHPWKALGKLVALTGTLFLIGLLPWVDNYAHIFGFIFGFLLSYALLPFVSFGPYDRRRKLLLIWVCLVAVLVMLAALIILFYVTPIYECKVCEYLNCIPFTGDLCGEQNIHLDGHHHDVM